MSATQPETVSVPMSSGIITAENVVAGYGDHIVWRDASFAVDRGEFVAIIGPNGAGKTTLFRLLLGLQRPISGAIRIFNARPRRGNPQIGYVPQRHVIDSVSNIECLELVRLAISGTRWGFDLPLPKRVSRFLSRTRFARRFHLFPQNEREIAFDTMRAVGAVELAHRSLNELSGGELQRIFLAEALVSNPGILLLDEPLSNLDIRRGRELVQLVNSLVRSRNVTAFLVAHDINPLLPFLDNVIYIANGKLATGKPSEVLTSEPLTALYGVQVEVMRDSRGNVAIIGTGTEDHHADELYGVKH